MLALRCVLFLLLSFFFWLTEPQSIEGMLRSQPGIHSVKVALLAERGVVEFDPQQWNAEKVINVRVMLMPPIIAFDTDVARPTQGNIRHWVRRDADTANSVR